MTETTFVVDHSMVGQTLDPADGFIQSIEWVGPAPPSRFDVPAMKPDGSGWANGYLTLRGEGDHGDLISFSLSNPVRRAVGRAVRHAMASCRHRRPCQRARKVAERR